MVDSFPSSVTDGDRPIQVMINQDLDNADRLQTAFEEAFPPGKPTFLRSRHRPQPAQLYPRLMAETSREWLTPLLRRLRWNRMQGEGDGQRVIRLSEMISQLVSRVPAVTEEEFADLARTAIDLAGAPRVTYLDHMRGFIRNLEDANAVGEAAVRGIKSLVECSRHIYPAGIWRDQFVWPLFRSEGGFAPDELCWSARVRRDLSAFDPSLRAAWLPVFDAERRAFHGACETSKSCRAAVEQLGEQRLQDGFRRWIGMLKDGTALQLSETGTAILRHIVLLIDGLTAPSSEELLCDIARAPWRRKQDAGWLETYLWVLSRHTARQRSPDRAFACLEALSMNPVTASEPVLEQYQSALATLLAEGGTQGVDGFPLHSDPSLESQHRRIDQVLRTCADAIARGPYIHPTVAQLGQLMESLGDGEMTPAARMWRAHMTAPKQWFDPGPDVKASLQALEAAIMQDFSADPDTLYRALLNRLDWILGHEKEYSRESVRAWTQRLEGASGMLRQALHRIDTLPLPWLLRTIERVPADMKVIELCQRQVAAHGWSVDLVEAIRKWLPSLGTSGSAHLERAKVEWFLWFEDAAPIQTEACWSHLVKRDLREMPAKERAAWLKLLQHSSFTVTAHPPKRWFQAAEADFPNLGPAVFRRRFVAWFDPFRKGEPLRLSVCGRNVLRVLIWTALIAKDPAVDEALAGFANAQWKTKEHQRRAAQAEMAFSYVLAQRAPQTTC